MHHSSLGFDAVANDVIRNDSGGMPHPTIGSRRIVRCAISIITKRFFTQQTLGGHLEMDASLHHDNGQGRGRCRFALQPTKTHDSEVRIQVVRTIQHPCATDIDDGRRIGGW